MSADITDSARFWEAVEWTKKHRTSVIVVLAGALVIGLAVGISWQMGESKQRAANAALIAAMEQTDAEGERIDPEPEALFRIAREYSGTSVAERAELLGAGALFEAGKFEEAGLRFKEFQTRYPGSALMGEAMLGVAASEHALGRTDQAMSAYRQVVAAYGNNPAGQQARLALAHILEQQKDFKGALGYFDDLINNPAISSSGWAFEARQRKQALVAEHPELAETNSLPVPGPRNGIPFAPGAIEDFKAPN